MSDVSQRSVLAFQVIAGAVCGLALAHGLGAPRHALEIALGHLATLSGHPPVYLDLLDDSEWDPESTEEQIAASRCRALLLEVIRRAAHDWILYRTHDRLQLRQIAEDAYIWLFEETPSHPWGRIRSTQGNGLTSFLTICELLDLDPDFVRERARSMTVQQIMSAGRPAERRKHADEPCVEYPIELNLEGLEGDSSNYATAYEAHFSVW